MRVTHMRVSWRAMSVIGSVVLGEEIAVTAPVSQGGVSTDRKSVARRVCPPPANQTVRLVGEGKMRLRGEKEKGARSEGIGRALLEEGSRGEPGKSSQLSALVAFPVAGGRFDARTVTRYTDGGKGSQAGVPATGVEEGTVRSRRSDLGVSCQPKRAQRRIAGRC